MLSNTFKIYVSMQLPVSIEHTDTPMKPYIIATVGLLAAAFLVAAAITVPNSAFAVQRIVGAPQSQAAVQQANNNGLAGVNAAVGVQAQVGQVCVNALNSAPSC
jgi:hypothetical protein